MIPRFAENLIQKAISVQAAVAIIGPRQVGKTTLALAIGAQQNAVYMDLENPDDRNKLVNPVLFLESLADRLVILDEIHRVPALFEMLRGLVDKGRREGKSTGRFLILGSASLELLQQSGESLAGRIAYIDLGPLTAIEIENNHSAREKLWLRGGFPQSYLADNDQDSDALRRDFIRTYLERDIPMLGPRIPATTMQRLWTMLAHHQSSLLNAAELARSLEVSTQSVTRYIDLLCDLLLVRRLPPYHANINKRLVKSPKVYIRDSGLLHTLLRIQTLEQLAGHPIAGASWEGFVIETLLSSLPWRSTAFFYRTAAGAEMDLVIEFGNGKVWAIEIKRSLSVKLKPGFYRAIEDLKPERCFVVYAGQDRYPLAENIEAIGLRDMATQLGSA